MRGKAVTVNVRMPKAKKGTRRKRGYRTVKQPYMLLKDIDPTWVRGSEASIARFGQKWKTATDAQKLERMKTHYRGNGLYTGGHGGYWGEKLGGLFGMPKLGSALGDVGGSLIRSFVPGGSTAMDIASGVGHVLGGHGAYAVNDTISGGGSSGSDPVPSFAPSTDGTRVTITHKEYISDIFGPDAPGFFQNTQYALNPAIERTFPWLSQIAAQYQEYTFSQLIFTFKSTVTDFNSGTGQVGTMVMVTQYNPSDEAFSDKMTMLESDLASSGKVSSHVLHGVECDPAKLSGAVGKYTRVGPPLGTQDIKTYDLGNLNIAVCNIPSNFFNQSLGELHVSYTVELRKPKQFSAKGWSIPRDAWFLRANAYWDSKDHPGGIYKLATNSIVTGQQNTINCQIIPCGPTTPAPAANTNEATALALSGWESGAPNNVYVIFPATAEGHFKITARWTALVPAYEANVTQANCTLQYMQCNGGYNAAVEPIYDMLGLDGASWVAERGPKAAEIHVTDAIQLIDGVMEFHCRVTNPAGAVASGTPKNATVCLQLVESDDIANNTEASLFGSIEVEVEQYNTLFNTKQDGSADMPVVCVQNDVFTSSGIIVPNWV